MKFVEIVETIESIETKLGTLSEAKLGLLETILEEGTDIEFDAVHYMDYLVEFVNAHSDENAEIIAETVNGGEILSIIMETVRKNPTDMTAFVTESVTMVENLDITLLEEDTSEESSSVTLLSVVTNTLTEMMGEEAVENMPAAMVFDIVEASKELDLSDDLASMSLVEMVEEISTKLEEAIQDGTIDLDTADYTSESLMEFLADYSDTEDLLEEMAQINDEILAEAEDEEGAELMRKAKSATVMLEAKMAPCPAGDIKCKISKAKKAKEYYSKNNMPGGGNPRDWSLNSLTGKLKKHVLAAVKASKTATGKSVPPEYTQYVLIPGIIKRMRMKNKKMNAKSKMKKQGMR